MEDNHSYIWLWVTFVQKNFKIRTLIKQLLTKIGLFQKLEASPKEDKHILS